jgi:hypothetical protein
MTVKHDRRSVHADKPWAKIEQALRVTVYMQSLEPEVRTAINSIYDELVGNGTDGPAPAAPRTAQESSKRTPRATVEHAETTDAKPVRGVVLEFATRMRQSRGREVLLNNWWT